MGVRALGDATSAGSTVNGVTLKAEENFISALENRTDFIMKLFFHENGRIFLKHQTVNKKYAPFEQMAEDLGPIASHFAY